MLPRNLRLLCARSCVWLVKLGICCLLIGALCLLPRPAVAQSGPSEETCYEKGAVRILMSWDQPLSIGALGIDDPYGNHSTSWKGWPDGINTPEGIEGGVDSGIPGSAMAYTGEAGSPIEFLLPDPREGTYRIRAAIPEFADPTWVTVEVYVNDQQKLSRRVFFHDMGGDDFYTWHWEVGEFVICGDKPMITGVKPQYNLDNTRFLESIPAANPIVVTVDWVGLTPDRVEFKLNGRVIASEQTSGRTVQHTLDMGSDLEDDLNQLEIIAYGKERSRQKSRPSDPQLFHFYSIPLPAWVSKLTGAGLMGVPTLLKHTSAGATYDMGFQIPVEPFTIDALRIGPPDGEAKFKWGINGGLSIPVDCVADLSAFVRATGSNIKFLRTHIELSASGALQFPRDGACGFLSPVGVVTVKGTYSGELYSKPVPVMVTYFNVVVGQTVDTIVVALRLERFIGKIGEFYIDGSLGLEASAKIDFAAPAVKDLGLGGEVGITGGFRSDLKVVEVNVYAGASGGISSVRPGVIDIYIFNNWQFDKITLKGEVGAKFRTTWFVREAKGSITWTYPAPAQQAASLTDEVVGGEWRLIPHPTRPPQSVLQPTPGAARAFAGRGPVRTRTGVQTTITSTLVSNIYPYPETALAVNPANDEAMIVWVDVDDAKPLGQAQELYFSRWDGLQWQPPTLLTDDQLLDGDAQIAWAADGQAVAVWQRANTLLQADATLTTTVTQQIEIAAASYNPVTDSWGAVSLLTTNSALDATPQLARSADGEIAAAWRRNPAGLLVGDAEAPDQIVAAFYANGWQPPAVAVDGIPGLLEFAIGVGTSSALNATTTIAYTQDVQPTGGITPTAQIFLTTWDGNAWSAPEQLTDEEQPQRNPQVLYTLNQIPFFPSENEPLLLWLDGNELRVRNLNAGATQSLPLSGEIQGVDDFSALLDGEGNIAVVFVNESMPRNLYLVLYDKANQLWGTPRRLTGEGQSLKFVAPAFDSTGRLLVAYAQSLIEFQEQTTADAEPITYTIPVETRTDLVTLSHFFVPNLKVTDADLAFARSETVEGQVVISATIHNDSDRAIRNVRVDFYQGDPESSGQWISADFLWDPIPGNGEATSTTSFVPGFLPEDFYVIVSAGGIVESDEMDNKARIPGVGADLEVVQTEVVYGQDGRATLRTSIRNNGYSDVYDGLLVYTLRGESQPVAQESLSVSAGKISTVATPVDLTGLPSGVHSLMATAGLTDSSEFTTDDNVAVASLSVLPDLAIGMETLPDNGLGHTTVSISATIHNAGAVLSAPVLLHIYSAGDFSTGSLLHTASIPSLLPRSAHHIAIQVPGPRCQLYLFVDPADTQDEVRRANNIAAILQPTEDCAPPPTPTNAIHLPMISGTK